MTVTATVLRNSWQQAIAPPWMSNGVAEKYHYALYLVLDAFLENRTQGTLASCPGFGTPTALGFIGNDVVIFRGQQETDAQYIQRLQLALDSWAHAGSALSLMQQFAGIIVPSQPQTRIVDTFFAFNASVWYTFPAGGTIHDVPTIKLVESPFNWLWDGNTGQWWRFWFIIYSQTGPIHPNVPIGTGTIGTGPTGQNTIGIDATLSFVNTLRQLVQLWKSKHSWCHEIIVTFDNTLFDPSKPLFDPTLPDGFWGNYGKLSGGVWVPSRNGSARYISGVPYQTISNHPLWATTTDHGKIVTNGA